MNNSTEKQEFISTRKAADMLGVAVSTIQLWTDDGVLQAWLTNGGHRRIDLKSVEALLSKRDLDIENSEIYNKKRLSAAKKKLTILLVEDDKYQIDLYRQQFEARDLNINLIEAYNGYDGLLKTGQYNPDIIITDLMMPDIDGFQMLKTLQNNENIKDCLIIVISALYQDEFKNRGGLPESVLFFTKPVVFDHLENAILKKMLNHL